MLLNGDIFPYPSYYKNVTGSDNYDNILRCEVGTGDMLVIHCWLVGKHVYIVHVRM